MHLRNKETGAEPIGPWYSYCGCFVGKVSQTWDVNDLIEFENNPNNSTLANDFKTIVDQCVKKMYCPRFIYFMLYYNIS